jgi:hypothetical protein
VAGEMRLAALVEFGFLGGDAAAGAGEDQHLSGLLSLEY